MTNVRPDIIAVEWPAEPIIDRFTMCVSMLAIHDFLTDKEKQKVYSRIHKWFESHKNKERR